MEICLILLFCLFYWWYLFTRQSELDNITICPPGHKRNEQHLSLYSCSKNQESSCWEGKDRKHAANGHAAPSVVYQQPCFFVVTDCWKLEALSQVNPSTEMTSHSSIVFFQLIKKRYISSFTQILYLLLWRICSWSAMNRVWTAFDPGMHRM